MPLQFSHLSSWIFLTLCVSAISSANTQMLGIYEFSGTGACPHNHTAVTLQPANAVFGSFSSVNTTCTASNDVFNNKAWNTSQNIDVSEYNEFKVMAANCFNMDLTVLQFDNKLSTGTANWFVRSSLDNFTANLATGIAVVSQTTVNVDLPATAFTGVDTVVFRFYLTGILSGTTTWRQDNVSLSGTINPMTPVLYFPDLDGDGFGAGTGLLLCSNPGGYALNGEDCADDDASVNPISVWFEDLDQDGFGNNDHTETGCTSTLTNATLQGNDCDDEDETINPTTVWYEDNDQDGFGNPDVSETACASSFSHATRVSGDCNDNEAAVFPGNTEICDGLDNDCDHSIDEEFTLLTYYTDNDRDGFGEGEGSLHCENPGEGFATNDQDCDDADAAINPAATDIGGNATDENCDGVDGTLGVNETNMAHFRVFPNPGDHFFVLSLNAFDENVKVCLYSITGMLLKEINTDPQQQAVSVNTENMASGSYLIEISQNGQKILLRWQKN